MSPIDPTDSASVAGSLHAPAVHVRLASVSKRFGETIAVDDVTLELARGETLALLGPSGCGKTTLLRMLAGLETPDEGTIEVSGGKVFDRRVNVRPEQRDVGLVFQEGGLFPHMTVNQNVAYGLGRTSDAARVRAALRLVDLAEYGDRAPETLSGGQAQRIALARALAPAPGVLCLDEPFASLDAGLRNRVRSEVAGLLGELDITAIFVTHDREEAFVVGDRVAVMRDGQIVQVGTPLEVYEAPRDQWVATFVSEANVIPGVARGEVADTALGPLRLSAPLHAACEVVVRPEHIHVGTGAGAVVSRSEYHGYGSTHTIQIGGVQLVARDLACSTIPPGSSVAVSYSGPPAVAFPLIRDQENGPDTPSA